ncbi:cofilin [Penicillium argentinense]|uniref:Cofilin n=1 Tax=Penicillium argentinense TaxID=1131581 RepID=A0A9W9KA79_9EURO|nr:cofilin [Penicillium argentinense]KAJ5098730.1 cofilin [Penicillium argentinense]
MSLASGVSVNDECIAAFEELRMSRGKVKYVIYKIADNMKEIVVEDKSGEADYEVFREKLASSTDANGKPAPRYATYDVEYSLGESEGKRNKIIFISWVPQDTPTRQSMVYASTREVLKNALNVANSIHADDKSEIEWSAVLAEASGGKAK